MGSSGRFLLDRTSENLVDVLPGALCLRDLGLPDDADDERHIFPAAVDGALTIVTENDRHFIAAMRKASARSGRVYCRGDGYGIIVPNHRRDVVFADFDRRLHLNGQHISLEDVRRFNLRVSLGEREYHVSRLPRCKFCTEQTSDAYAKRLGLA